MILTLPEQIWRMLSQRWLLLLVGGVTFWLVICAFTLEQLPAHLQNDPSATTRWMLDTSLHYGSLGDLFRNLGLFNILHSRLLHILLTLTGFLLLISLANLIDVAYHLRKLPSLLQKPISVSNTDESLEVVAGHALDLQPTYQKIYRRRSTHATSPDMLASKISAYLDSLFGQLHRESLILPVEITSAAESAAEEISDDLSVEKPAFCEERLLGIHYPEMIYLRILAVVGLLLAALAVSLTVVLGWEIETEALAPGDSFRNVQHDFELAYHVVPPITENDKLATHLEIHVGDIVERLSTAAGSFMQVGVVRVWAEPSHPALLVSNLGDTPLLARPGQFSPSPMIGLLFPSPGSEESLILPRQRVGLRIVRMSDSNISFDENRNRQNTVVLSSFPEDDARAYMIEIFREEADSAGNMSDEQPQRYYISDQQPTTLPVDGLDALIRLDPVSSLQVEGHHMPGLWLAWPAFVMALIGFSGFWRQPRFLVIQICPWPTERSVIVIQGNVAADVENVEAWLHSQD